MITEQAESVIASAPVSVIKRYRAYWKKISPKTDLEHWKRWVFAFGSVNSGVAANLNFVNYVDKLPSRLHEKYSVSRVQYLLRVGSHSGMCTVRGKGIWEFSKSFWENPDFWRKQTNESFVQARDRMKEKLFGLGIAKTSFALEMIYPEECDVVCLDRHHQRLYGVPDNELEKRYNSIESHWVETCRNRGLPPALVRHWWWDNRRSPKQKDTRYWSYVLEN